MVIENYTVDTLLEMKDAGLVATSARATVSAAAKIIDLGAGVVDGFLVLDVTALEIASNDEAYTIVFQGSPDSDFGTAGNIHDIMQVHLGAKETKLSDCDKDDAPARIILPVRNVGPDGTIYRYVSLYTVVAGTIATGINYTARLAKRHFSD